MKHGTLLLLLVALFIARVHPTLGCDQLNSLINVFCDSQNNVASVVVKTKQGLVRGEYLEAVTGDCEYASFKGIPFAKPPVGDLRFMAPQPPVPWKGVRNATQHGPVCTQISIYNGVDISGSEDCLYLNVYTPDVNPEKPLPVMFFIHGGGFQSGSGNSDRYGPDYLVAQNIVLVTANHRLGALGFLNLNTKEVPGNAGIKDQVAALRWVQQNIAYFGGDPNEVTIFGQSAGAVSVGCHNLSPMSKGLFKRGLAMSGSPLTDWARPFEPVRVAFRLGQQLGYWTRDVQKLYTFLRCLPPEKLLGTNPAVLRSQDPKILLRQLTFTPVVENDFGQERFLTACPMSSLKNGLIHNVDLLIGHTAIEGNIKFIIGGESVPDLYTNYTEMLVPRGVLENISPASMFSLADRIHAKYFGVKQIDNNVGKEFIKFLSDASFNYGITKYGQVFSAYRKTFMYKFSKQPNFPRYGNSQNQFGTTGPMHEDDLLYVFNPGNVTVDTTTEDYKVIKTLTTLYANFAKYGNPTPNKQLGVKWAKYERGTGCYLDIDKKLTVRKDLDGEAIAFWDSIYEEAGLPI